jgi:hypothetical protein
MLDRWREVHFVAAENGSQGGESARILGARPGYSHANSQTRELPLPGPALKRYPWALREVGYALVPGEDASRSFSSERIVFSSVS